MKPLNYNQINKLKYWCQMVLPTIYDDSLSYMELLNKVVKHLNITIENVNELKRYLQDFIENIEVKEIIIDYIDELIETGELENIITLSVEDDNTYDAMDYEFIEYQNTSVFHFTFNDKCKVYLYPTNNDPTKPYRTDYTNIIDFSKVKNDVLIFNAGLGEVYQKFDGIENTSRITTKLTDGSWFYGIEQNQITMIDGLTEPTQEQLNQLSENVTVGYPPIIVNGVRFDVDSWIEHALETYPEYEEMLQRTKDYVIYPRHSRNIVAVDNNNVFHVFFIMGRVPGSQYGMDYNTLYNFLSGYNLLNAVMLDGGGSMQIAINGLSLIPKMQYANSIGRRVPIALICEIEEE